jgi:hypothetical protein
MTTVSYKNQWHSTACGLCYINCGSPKSTRTSFAVPLVRRRNGQSRPSVSLDPQPSPAPSGFIGPSPSFRRRSSSRQSSFQIRDLTGKPEQLNRCKFSGR